MYGERFIEKKIDGNKIIRISEFKDFKHNYLDLIEDLNDYITDDWEALADRTIYFNRMEEFDNFEVDSVLEWVEEIIEEKKEDGEEVGEYAWLEKWIKPLQEAKGFIIHLNWKPDWVAAEHQDKYDNPSHAARSYIMRGIREEGGKQDG